MINTIIFDIGNVLTSFCWREYYESQGYDAQLVERMAKATVLSDDWKEMDLGNLPFEDVLTLFVENDPEIEKELRSVLSDMSGILTKMDYAIPWLTELKSKGYRLLFLSNFSSKILEDCAPAMGFLSLMDGGIFSFRVHLTKPNPAIYQTLITQYQLNPSECVFIDDMEENVVAARKSGLQGIVFKDVESTMKELLKN